jgi:hypothetical protein
MFEPRARLGETTRLSRLGSSASKEAIYCGRTDLHELVVALLVKLKSASFVESGQLDVHCCSQQLGTNTVEQIPEKEQMWNQSGTILSTTGTLHGVLHIISFAVKQRDGILAIIAGGLYKLV